MREMLKAILEGYVIGVKATSKMLHIPVWVGHVIVPILIPLNLLAAVFLKIFKKQSFVEMGREISKSLYEEEA